jgi:hypothetical protein
MISRAKQFVIISLATLCAPAFGANPAHPGTINYIEGSAFVAGQPVSQQSVGTVSLDPGQVLSTENGKAEILLTPGIYLRLDDDSAVKMVSPDLTLTQLELEQGRATVEVDEIHAENDVQIIEARVPTQLLKTGLYEFNANDDVAAVFKGQAAAQVAPNKWVAIKEGHQLALNDGPRVKSQHFDQDADKDELYNWSSLRSEYLSKANADLSGYYASAGYGPGWYWDPWDYGYTFIGAYPFYSPFGWGFYPFGYYGGFGYGYYGRGHYYRGGAYRGQVAGGFHGEGGGFHGGGFAGGGGFHGGGGGGGHR